MEKSQQYREEMFLILSNFRSLVRTTHNEKNIKEIKKFLEKIPKIYWEDKNFCEKISDCSSVALLYIKKDFLNNSNFFMARRIIRVNEINFIKENISEKDNELLFGDKDFISKIMRYDIKYFWYATDKLKKDKEMVKEVMSAQGLLSIEGFIHKDLLEDKIFIIELINENNHLLRNKHIFKELTEKFTEKDFVDNWFLLDLKLKDYVIENIEIEKISEEAILDYIKNQSPYFNIFQKHRNKKIKFSMNILKEFAVNNFKSLPIEYRNNEEIINYAIRKNPRVWMGLPEKWKNNKELCLSVMKSLNIWIDLSPDLKRDHEIIFESLFIHGFNLNDLGILKKLNKEIFDNMNFAKVMISDNVESYVLFNEEIKSDKELIDKVVLRNEYNLLNKSLKEDVDFNLDLIERNIIQEPMATLSNSMLYKEEILIKLIKSNPSVIYDYLTGGNLTKKEIFEKKHVVQAIAKEVSKYFEKEDPKSIPYQNFVKYYMKYREEDLLMEMDKIKAPVSIKKPKI